jgi:hypothetical protein
MAERTFKVRVFVKPVQGTGRAVEDLSKNITVRASTVDKAGTIARARLEAALVDVTALSHGPDSTILVTANHAPRKGPPTTIVASVAAGKMRR